MSSSSSTSHRYRHRNVRPLVICEGVIPNCVCPSTPKAKEQTSWTNNHPRRRFYNCAMSLVSTNACEYFEWLDPELRKYYKDLIKDMKNQLSGKKECEAIVKLEKKLAKLQSKRVADQEKFDKELNRLAGKNVKMYAELMWTRLVVVALLLVVVAKVMVG